MTLIDYKELYDKNERIKEYVDKYAQCHAMAGVPLSPERTMQCMVVQAFIAEVLKEEGENVK